MGTSIIHLSNSVHMEIEEDGSVWLRNNANSIIYLTPKVRQKLKENL
jgi:hypothetical protein